MLFPRIVHSRKKRRPPLPDRNRRHPVEHRATKLDETDVRKKNGNRTRDAHSIRRERENGGCAYSGPRSRRGFAAPGDPLFRREEGLRGPATLAIDPVDKSHTRAVSGGIVDKWTFLVSNVPRSPKCIARKTLSRKTKCDRDERDECSRDGIGSLGMLRSEIGKSLNLIAINMFKKKDICQ